MKKRFYADGGVAAFQSKFAQARKSGASSFEDSGRKYSTDVEKTDATDNAAVLKLQEQMLAEKHYTGKLTGMANSDTMVAYAKAKDAGMVVSEAIEKSLPMFMQMFHKQKQKEKAAEAATTSTTAPVTPAVTASVSAVKEGGIEQGVQGSSPIEEQKFALPATITSNKPNTEASKAVMNKDQVVFLQTQLKDKGFYKEGSNDSPDGKFGSATAAAVENFFNSKEKTTNSIDFKEKGVSDAMIKNSLAASKMYAKKGSTYSAPNILLKNNKGTVSKAVGKETSLPAALTISKKAVVKEAQPAIIAPPSKKAPAPAPAPVNEKKEDKLVYTKEFTRFYETTGNSIKDANKDENMSKYEKQYEKISGFNYYESESDAESRKEELPIIFSDTTFDEFYKHTIHGKKGIRHEYSRINYRKIYDEIRANKRSAVRLEAGDKYYNKFYTVNYKTDYRSTVEDKKYGDDSVGSGNPLGGWKNQVIVPPKK